MSVDGDDDDAAVVAAVASAFLQGVDDETCIYNPQRIIIIVYSHPLPHFTFNWTLFLFVVEHNRKSTLSSLCYVHNRGDGCRRWGL